VTAILDLRQEARRTPLALDAALALGDETRRAAVADWTARMVDEQNTSRLFAGLLPQMMRAGIDVQFQVAAADAVVDELRHARLCAAVVEALGGAARAPIADGDDPPRAADAGPLESLIRNVIEISCLGETADVAVLEHRYRHARESTFRRVIAEILDDEIAHSRLGWRLLQQLEPRIDARLRERLGAFLVPAFARLLDRHGARARRADADAALLLVAMNEVIVPRLEAFELPAREAFEAAHTASDDDDDPIVWAATD
jgi:hypothetical protein